MASGGSMQQVCQIAACSEHFSSVGRLFELGEDMNVHCTICTCVVTSSFHAADFEACLKAFQEASVLFSRHPSHSVTLTPATAQSAVPSIVNREYNNDYQSLLSLSHNIYILMLIILCRLILHPLQQYIHLHKTRVFTI